MVRKRMVDPAMFTSPTVSAWSPATRWTWLGLLCYLDDYGYGEDSPDLVKGVVWPRDSSYTARKVRDDLDRIVVAGSLCRFDCCARTFIHIPKWTDWQKVAHPAAFRNCPCPIHDAPASRIHHEELMRLSRAAHPSVVQSNVKSLSDQPTDQPPSGSDGLAAAREAATKLRTQSA